jgi:hypothetical protein
VFEQAKTFHALDGAATGIGKAVLNKKGKAIAVNRPGRFMVLISVTG